MARRSANKGRGSLANGVLQYLINHERAHDTVEGIVAWWLRQQRIRYAISEFDAVLRELVVSGVVIGRKTSEGGIHYCMKPIEQQAICRRLETMTVA